MKQLYTIIIAIFFTNGSLFADSGIGYIITKDAKIITGEVEKIFYSDWISEITFVNGMGTKYVFQPWLIYGFAIQKNDELIMYESKFEKGHWRFLKVMIKGEVLSLYGCPPKKTRQVREVWGLTNVVWTTKEFWLERSEEAPIRLFKINFKKKLEEYIKSEEILNKLGSPGYRYRDIPKIIQEYNEMMRKGIINI